MMIAGRHAETLFRVWVVTASHQPIRNLVSIQLSHKTEMTSREYSLDTSNGQRNMVWSVSLRFEVQLKISDMFLQWSFAVIFERVDDTDLAEFRLADPISEHLFSGGFVCRERDALGVPISIIVFSVPFRGFAPSLLPRLGVCNRVGTFEQRSHRLSSFEENRRDA
ncbi:hypothetical protein [Schlesneria sp. T3-172]|uniref:hypothetical protein n=1 Tax=Schlesneria sphaerica TaxID=3373610 RepID=UPI0037C81C44